MMPRCARAVLFSIVVVMMVAAGAVAQSVTGLVAPKAAAGNAAPKAAATALPAASPAAAALMADYGRLPLSFEVNEGQTAGVVKFVARGGGYSLFLTERGAVLSLSKRGADAVPKSDVIRMELVGAAADSKVSGVGPLAGKANYLIGNDPSKWHTDVATFARVKYAGVYPGVDLVYYGNQRQLEYDFVVAAGANAGEVRVRFDGARRLRVGADGNLQIFARNGEIAFQKPVVYQMRDGRREPVDGRFELKGNNEVGFALGNYDASRELVIDPVLAYSTYLGGSGGDFAAGIAVDAEGNAYIAGGTYSTDFPLKGNPYQTTNKGAVNGFSNVFVTKMNPAGTGLDYSTYLGGSGVPPALQNVLIPIGGDSPSAIAIDRFGNAYITGQTFSMDFPVTSGALQTVNKGAGLLVTNAFVTKLNPIGSGLVYSTYLGGSGIPPFAPFASPVGDSGAAIALDSAGNAYVTGAAYSPDFPLTSGAFQKQNNGVSFATDNAFVSKINAAGSALIYSTYLGGSGQLFNFAGPGDNMDITGDSGAGIAVDVHGNAYVAGRTFSNDFPVTDGAYQKVNNAGYLSSSNAFVTKLNAAGNALIYSTYLGGSVNTEIGGPSPFNDEANAIAIDTSGNAYVAGATIAPDFPVTTGAFQTVSKGQNVFVTKLNADGSALLYSTYLGGTGGDNAAGIVVDGSGDSFVTGSTGSTDFPVTSDAFQMSSSGTFISELSANFEELVYSTYFGGSFGAGGIAMDPAGNIYVAGSTGSTDFPTTRGAFQHKLAGNVAYVAKFAVNSTEEATATTLSANINPQFFGDSVTFTAQVTPLTGGGEPTGQVLFGVNGNLVSVKDLDSTGRASIPIVISAQSNVTAFYRGDGMFAASAASYIENVTSMYVELTLVSGADQRAAYGMPFPNPLVFQTTGTEGPRAGVQVTLSSTDMRFSSTIAVTGANGEVSVYATPTATGNLRGMATVKYNLYGNPLTFPEAANPGVLTVTARNVSVPQGKPIPALTYSITGFENGDKATVVSGTPTLSTVAEGTAEGSYPIAVAMGTLAATNYKFKLVNGTLTITSAGRVVKPVFTPAGNVFSSPPKVMMTDATPGSVIYYTTDGTTPTVKSSLYTGPITVTKTEVISAIGAASGYASSEVTIENYRVE
ncbi:MAG: SBBP repeat-containing protein [Candidatus Acidiferrales bacterium]